jgi:thymidylate kinase
MLSLSLVSRVCQEFPKHHQLAKIWLETFSKSESFLRLIVIEGMDGVGKTTAAQGLLHALGKRAQLFYSLPPEFKAVRSVYDQMEEYEKRQFYLLGGILTVMKAYQTPGIDYCILDRSYATTVAYHRGNLVFEGQSQDRSTLIQWLPALKPDWYFYLVCSEKERRQRLENRTLSLTTEEQRLEESKPMRDEIDWSYRNFQGFTNIVDVDLLIPSKVVKILLEQIRKS